MDDKPVLLIPGAGPLITLAYANSLDLLTRPGWPVHVVDMVMHEVTRNETPTSTAIASWVNANKIVVVPTRTFAHFQQKQALSIEPLRKSNLGELAIQETMNTLALTDTPPVCVFLFEDHKIARPSFLLPEKCQKVSTRSFLIFLEQKGWLESAVAIERAAIRNGRHFSQLRFPASE